MAVGSLLLCGETDIEEGSGKQRRDDAGHMEVRVNLLPWSRTEFHSPVTLETFGTRSLSFTARSIERTTTESQLIKCIRKSG